MLQDAFHDPLLIVLLRPFFQILALLATLIENGARSEITYRSVESALTASQVAALQTCLIFFSRQILAIAFGETRSPFSRQFSRIMEREGDRNPLRKNCPTPASFSPHQLRNGYALKPLLSCLKRVFHYRLNPVGVGFLAAHQIAKIHAGRFAQRPGVSCCP